MIASFAAITDGSDIAAMVSATLSASSIRIANGTTRATRPERSASVCVHHAAGQDHVHGLGLADRMRETLRATDARNDTELDLRLTELRIVGGDDDVAQHRQLAATAERVAGHRRHHRLARARNAMPVGGEFAHGHVVEAIG